MHEGQRTIFSLYNAPITLIIYYYYYDIKNVETCCMYKSLFSLYTGESTIFLFRVLVNH